MSESGGREAKSGPLGFAMVGVILLVVGVLFHYSERPPKPQPSKPDATPDATTESHDVAAPAVAYGVSERKAWTTSRVVGTPEPPPPYRTELAFPKLKFRNPVVLAKPPGMARYFMGEQSGRIFSFSSDPQCERADLALDVERDLLTPVADGKGASPVDNQGIKGLEALYGLTFHPDFAHNRYCYVCYVVRGEAGKQLPDGTRVSRFRVTETDPPRLDPASEQLVISWLQGGHNGGCLAFGPDGCLYISTGDGGFANPPDGLNSGQDVTNLLSSILRIDVDHPDPGRNYGIPADNPLVDIAAARGEIWCYGLRNPWKMSFDRQTGELWVGDVGWELWELVYRVERGGNYGWSVVEGRQPVHPQRKVGPTPILPPTIELPHTDGVSITGGYVYRGKKFPELNGQYLFGDWETRRIWASTWDASTKTAGPRRDLVDPAVRLVAFAEDDDGELLLVDYDDGTIHTFAKNEPKSDQPEFPRRLSQTGLFASTADQTPAAGVYSFSVNAEQWSDFATARRWIAIPGRGTVRMLPQKSNVPGSMFQSSTVFPVNTVLVKTLALESTRGDPASSRRVETQLLHFDGKFWRGYSYRWNDEQTDAELVGPLGGEVSFEVRAAALKASDSPSGQSAASSGPTRPSTVEPRTWHFSSRVECARCHNQWAEYALAFNLRQLNRTHDYDGVRDNQLRTLEHLEVIRLPPASLADSRTDSTRTADEFSNASDASWHAMHYARLVDPYDTAESLAERARSYLHVNCAHCHRTGGGGTAYIELQQELALESMKAVDVRPTQGTFDMADARIIAPSDPYRSTLFLRISKTGSGRMPHVGSEILDERGVRLMHDWIRDLPPNFDVVALVRKLRESDEGEAAAREAREAEQRQQPIAERLASQRRERERTAAGAKGPPPTEPALVTDEDRQAARREDERQSQDRVRARAVVRRETIEKLLGSTGRALLLTRALDEGSLPTGVRAEVLEASLTHPSPTLRDLFDRFAPPEKRAKRLGAHVRAAEILALDGDITRGAVLFANTNNVQCKNCHRIGKIGSTLGPDLTLIGKKYNRDQLLEHILEPSKLVDPKYVSYVASLTDGRVIQGLLTARTADEFVFRDIKDREVRVLADDVDSIAPQRQSLMPELLLRDFTAQQVADLLAYLADRK